MKIEGFSNMLNVIQAERGISKDVLVSAIEAALLSASKKKFINGDNLSVKIDEEGNVKVFAKKIVSEAVEDEELQIALESAKEINKKASVGEEIEIDVTPKDFGRFAAQTAKQVIMQRLREAEKDISFEEFTKKQGDLVTGTVQQKEFNGYLINLGRIEALLQFSEVPHNEMFRLKDRVKVYVVEVNRTSKGPVILISRTHPGMVKKLFELEIPEIVDGTLEIKNVVREAGRRTKISLTSKDPNIRVVGTCVGHMGARIQNIVKELGNERIDIIEWKEDPKSYIANALSPAKPVKIELNEKEMSAVVIVAESQLSLAIGKEGQNVRLASKLTGWKLDIKSESAEEAPAEVEAETQTKTKKKAPGKKTTRRGGKEKDADAKEESAESEKDKS